MLSGLEMKLATFKWRDTQYLGAVDEESHLLRRPTISTESCADQGVMQLIDSKLSDSADTFDLTDVMLMAPIPRPNRNIFCVGKNYHDHAMESSRSGFDSSATQGEVPSVPIIFSKVPDSVIGPGAAIHIDSQVSNAIDYEVELAVIIGKSGRNIEITNALDHVWGYTIINDVTARDLQAVHSQWLIGKSQDTFCQMGPWVIMRDELNLSDTAVRCLVNGQLRQNANTGDLIFDVPSIIAAISNGITLMPGDVIATGTPAGVGIGFNPPRYLQAGDLVRMEIEGLGVLENPVEHWLG